MPAIKKILYGFSILVILATIFSFLTFDFWWMRVFDFPRIQFTLLTFGAIILFLLKFDYKNTDDKFLLITLFVCLIFQIINLHPFTVMSSKEILDSDESKDSLKILTANVLQENKKYNLLIDEINAKDPDILVLTEVDEKWINEVNKVTNEKFSYSKEYPLDNTYGIALYSKLPLLSTEVKFIISDTIPSIETNVILKNNTTIKLYAIHPTPPVPQENSTSTNRDAEIMTIAKKSMNRTLPVIVVGDFNDVSWSTTTGLFRDTSRLLDGRVGRGFFNTFDATNFVLKWPLDHIFVSEEFRLKSINKGNDINSDHLPYYAVYTFEPEKSQEQKKPNADESEIELMNDFINKAKE